MHLCAAAPSELVCVCGGVCVCVCVSVCVCANTAADPAAQWLNDQSSSDARCHHNVDKYQNI